MGAVSLSRFIELAGPTNPRASYFISEVKDAMQQYRYGDYATSVVAVDREAAIVMYSQAKAFVQERGYFNNKNFRPWEVDPELTSKLDRSEPWWGFEFEMGFNTNSDRAEVIGHVWDNWDGVAFDGEGEGEHFVEITFTPQEQSKFRDKTAQATQFMEYISANADVTNDTGYEAVGMHFNLSHPEITTYDMQHAVGAMLNNTLHLIPRDGRTRTELFGREYIYGGFFERSAGTSLWLEGKLFRTTYSEDTFAGYIAACEGMTRCVNAALEYWKENAVTVNLGVTNLADVVAGADPIFLVSTSHHGRPYCDFVTGTHSPRGEDDDDDYYDDNEGEY